MASWVLRKRGSGFKEWSCKSFSSKCPWHHGPDWAFWGWGRTMDLLLVDWRTLAGSEGVLPGWGSSAIALISPSLPCMHVRARVCAWRDHFTSGRMEAKPLIWALQTPAWAFVDRKVSSSRIFFLMRPFRRESGLLTSLLLHGFHSSQCPAEGTLKDSAQMSFSDV